MRFMLAADLHGGTNRYNVPVAGPLGSSRLVEFEQVLDRLGTAAIENACNFVFIGGDLFDHRHPTPAMLRLVTAFCARMGKAGINICIVPGNHDGPHALGQETSHTLYWLRALDLLNVRVYTRPTVDFIAPYGVTIVAMPYPHRRTFDVQEPLQSALPEDRVIEAGRKMEELIRAYGREARERHGRDIAVIFLGHMTVLGSRTASEQLMRMEWDIAVEPDAFEDYDFVALGHIHKAQGVGEKYDTITHPVTGDRQEKVWYPGSPVYLDFSEADQSKGFLLVEVVPGHASVIPVRSDPREMVRVKLEYWPGVPAEALTGLQALDGTICELTITGDTEPPAAWVEATEDLFRRQAFIVKTKMDITPRERIAALVTTEEEDLTNKEVALRRYLRERGLPEEPYMTAGREIIEAHR